jgi:predicted component of type VI protein secretion system
MDLKLRVLEGKNAGQEIAVNCKKFFIGRAEDCHLRPGSDLISRHHCVLLADDGYLGIRDFGSKNGTFVNDERVVGERELKPGDQLTIGPLRFEIHISHGLGGKKRPPVGDIKEAAARTAQDAAQDPMDVTQWLSGEADADAQSTVTADTRNASMTDTDSIRLDTSNTVADDPVPDDAKAKGPREKRQPGKLPPMPNASKDSQEAAAAMLNKLRKRR